MPTNIKWGHTQVNVTRCIYTWTIGNFSYLQKRTGEELESPCFTLGPNEVLDEPKYCLRLYPRGINDNFKDNLSLYIYRKAGNAEARKLEGRYKLALLDVHGETFVEACEEIQYNKNYTSWGFPAFAKSELVKDAESGVLAKDSLTFRCEVAMVDGCHSVSSDDGSSIGQASCRPSPNSPIVKPHQATNDFEKLLLNETFSDVKLIASCGTELRAHRNILAARSPIFAAMFEHDMMEKTLAEVNISDVEHDVLKEMLRYVYAERVENVEQLACRLLAAADKYEIEGLKTMCEKVLGDRLSVDNVIEVLVVAERHNIGHLKGRALNFVKAHVKDVIESEGFKTMANADVLTDIMRALVL